VAAGVANRLPTPRARYNILEVRYSEDLSNRLSSIPNRGPTSHYDVYDEIYTEHRFWASPDARVCVIINESKGTATVCGFGTEAILLLWADLKDRLADRITQIVWEPPAAERPVR
jgi:hypothetical protein